MDTSRLVGGIVVAWVFMILAGMFYSMTRGAVHVAGMRVIRVKLLGLVVALLSIGIIVANALIWQR